jgi:hypothetical protein
MRDIAVGAIFDPLLQIHKVSAALIPKGVQGTATKHAVEIVPLHLVTGKVFTRIVFEISTAVFHSRLPICKSFDYLSIILHLPCKKQEFRQKFLVHIVSFFVPAPF